MKNGGFSLLTVASVLPIGGTAPEQMQAGERPTQGAGVEFLLVGSGRCSHFNSVP